MKSLLSHLLAGILGLWLATMVVPGTALHAYPGINHFGLYLTADWQVFLTLGAIIGLTNWLALLLIHSLSLPLARVTNEITAVILGAGILWLADQFFVEFSVPFWQPLLYAAVIVWVANLIIMKLWASE